MLNWQSITALNFETVSEIAKAYPACFSICSNEETNLDLEVYLRIKYE